MAYNLIITERADGMIDRLTAYLVNHLKNPDAASHFLDELDSIYSRLEDNPYQFTESKDEYLFLRGYRDALFEKMKYHVIFRVDEQSVYILGVFHTLEDYASKLY
ncbi:MAG: type II toxin-antitoxin system RelE/ParE family toxin [Clostridia bacterium]|nr:type II toxin-antitoxin system RelE/ParE family toxin [Clostridia bacterium]